MPYKAKVKKRRASGRIKLFLILSIVVTSLLLLGLLGWFGWQWYEEKKAFEALALELATPRIVVPEGHFTPKAKPEVHVSENIRGGKLVPGVDFYTDIGCPAGEDGAAGHENHPAGHPPPIGCFRG